MCVIDNGAARPEPRGGWPDLRYIVKLGQFNVV